MGNHTYESMAIKADLFLEKIYLANPWIEDRTSMHVVWTGEAVLYDLMGVVPPETVTGMLRYVSDQSAEWLDTQRKSMGKAILKQIPTANNIRKYTEGSPEENYYHWDDSGISYGLGGEKRHSNFQLAYYSISSALSKEISKNHTLTNPALMKYINEGIIETFGLSVYFESALQDIAKGTEDKKNPAFKSLAFILQSYVAPMAIKKALNSPVSFSPETAIALHALLNYDRYSDLRERLTAWMATSLNTVNKHMDTISDLIKPMVSGHDTAKLAHFQSIVRQQEELYLSALTLNKHQKDQINMLTSDLKSTRTMLSQMHTQVMALQGTIEGMTVIINDNNNEIIKQTKDSALVIGENSKLKKELDELKKQNENLIKEHKEKDDVIKEIEKTRVRERNQKIEAKTIYRQKSAETTEHERSLNSTIDSLTKRVEQEKNKSFDLANKLDQISIENRLLNDKNVLSSKEVKKLKNDVKTSKEEVNTLNKAVETLTLKNDPNKPLTPIPAFMPQPKNSEFVKVIALNPRNEEQSITFFETVAQDTDVHHEPELVTVTETLDAPVNNQPLEEFITTSINYPEWFFKAYAATVKPTQPAASRLLTTCKGVVLSLAQTINLYCDIDDNDPKTAEIALRNKPKIFNDQFSAAATILLSCFDSNPSDLKAQNALIIARGIMLHDILLELNSKDKSTFHVVLACTLLVKRYFRGENFSIEACLNQLSPVFLMLRDLLNSDFFKGRDNMAYTHLNAALQLFNGEHKDKVLSMVNRVDALIELYVSNRALIVRVLTLDANTPLTESDKTEMKYFYIAYFNITKGWPIDHPFEPEVACAEASSRTEGALSLRRIKSFLFCCEKLNTVKPDIASNGTKHPVIVTQAKRDNKDLDQDLYNFLIITKKNFIMKACKDALKNAKDGFEAEYPLDRDAVLFYVDYQRICRKSSNVQYTVRSACKDLFKDDGDCASQVVYSIIDMLNDHVIAQSKDIVFKPWVSQNNYFINETDKENLLKKIRALFNGLQSCLATLLTTTEILFDSTLVLEAYFSFFTKDNFKTFMIKRGLLTCLTPLCQTETIDKWVNDPGTLKDDLCAAVKYFKSNNPLCMPLDELATDHMTKKLLIEILRVYSETDTQLMQPARAKINLAMDALNQGTENTMRAYIDKQLNGSKKNKMN